MVCLSSTLVWVTPATLKKDTTTQRGTCICTPPADLAAQVKAQTPLELSACALGLAYLSRPARRLFFILFLVAPERAHGGERTGGA